MKALPLWLALVGAPSSEPPDVAAAEEQPVVVESLILDAGGMDANALQTSLASRLPNAAILPFSDVAFERVRESRFAYVRVNLDGELARVTIVLSDGRAYERAVTTPPGLELRAVATTIANTMVAIEQERLPADRVNEPIPRPPDEPPDEPAREPPEELPEPTPEPEVPEEAPAPSPVTPRTQLGLGLMGGPVVGLAPAQAAGLAAGGGELRASLRWPTGPVAAVGIRVVGQRGDDAGLLRTRIALGGGYALRRERLEVVFGAAATVEPWWIAGGTFGGNDAARARRSPLLGGMGWTSVGYLAGSVGGVQTRIGAFAELGSSVVPSGTAARVVRGDPTATEAVFTLGGVELSAGLDVAVWFSLPGR